MTLLSVLGGEPWPPTRIRTAHDDDKTTCDKILRKMSRFWHNMSHGGLIFRALGDLWVRSRASETEDVQQATNPRTHVKTSECRLVRNWRKIMKKRDSGETWIVNDNTSLQTGKHDDDDDEWRLPWLQHLFEILNYQYDLKMHAILLVSEMHTFSTR